MTEKIKLYLVTPMVKKTIGWKATLVTATNESSAKILGVPSNFNESIDIQFLGFAENIIDERIVYIDC